MPATKPHGKDDEILYLITIRRGSALRAMRRIVKRYGLRPHFISGVSELNDYLTNMVFCLELMLKLLSGDWNTHCAEQMYRSVLGAPDAAIADLLQRLEKAVKDQKYLIEPAMGLEACIPNLERLYDQLVGELRKRHQEFAYKASISAPKEFAEFVRDHVDRFYKTDTLYSPFSHEDFERRKNESMEQRNRIRDKFNDLANSGSGFEFREEIDSLY